LEPFFSRFDLTDEVVKLAGFGVLVEGVSGGRRTQAALVDAASGRSSMVNRKS